MANDVVMNLRTRADVIRAIPQKWDRQIRSAMYRREVFAKMEGKEESGSAIIVRRDFTKDKGEIVRITVESELHAAGTIGTTTRMKGREEKPAQHQFNVTLGLVRHSEGIKNYADERAFTNGIIKAGGRLARWIARRRDDYMFHELLGPSGVVTGTDLQGITFSNPTPRVLCCGGKATAADLTSTDVLSPDDIALAKLALVRTAIPLRIQSSRGEELEIFQLLMDEVTSFRFFQNTEWKAAVQNLLPRSFDHPLMTGAIGMWDGVLLTTVKSVLEGCHCGTAIRPECAVTTAFDNGSTLVVGTVTDRTYTRHFPDTGTLIGLNTDNTEVVMTYAGKTDYSFTGVAVTSSDKALAVGSRVTLDKYLARNIMHGAEIAVRAYGSPDQKVSESDDYSEEPSVGIRQVFGQSVVQDSEGNAPNYLILDSYSKLPHPGV